MNLEELLTHAGFIRSLARSLVLDEHRAADITQETLLAALQKPPPPDRPVRAWLAKVTKNFARILHRRESRRRKYETALAGPETIASPEEITRREESIRCMTEAVLGLNEPYRAPILLRFYEDLSISEIANRLNLPPSTVKTHLKRGLEQLKLRLDAKYKGGREEWIATLVPLAGLKLIQITGGAAAGTAALPGGTTAAFSAKIVFTAAALLTIVGGSLWWFVVGSEPEATSLSGTNQFAVPPVEKQDSGQNSSLTDPDLEPLDRSILTGMPVEYARALGAFQGRVVDERHQPLAAKHVEICGLAPNDLIAALDLEDSGGSTISKLKRVTTVTKKDGTFEFTGIYPRAFYLLRIDPENHPASTRLVDGQPNPGETVMLGDLILKNRPAITGCVKDDQGLPLKGARVRAFSIPPQVLQIGLQNLDYDSSVLAWGLPFLERPFVMNIPSELIEWFEMLPVPSALTAENGAFVLKDVPVHAAVLVA
ncbi:MAG: sigma-70 family RNA polymerase sigma factor, partial [Planctomycetes bacterium]|nr:sigma-70 family RNA polymerase sigma factor [Planctomycetota bacterium]